MKKSRAISIVFLFILSGLRAQVSPEYSFEFFNASHGLPSSEIISLAKDSKGFLWIGTSAGLSRYDGYNFHNYAFAKGGELIGYVNVIKADQQQRLWIGSGAGLFYCYQDEIIKISTPNASPQGINDILVDGERLWLSAESGPALLQMSAVDLSGKNKISISDFILKEWVLKNSPNPEARSVTHIAKADDGTIFVSQASAIYRLNNTGIELLHSIADRHDQVLSMFPVNHNKFYFDAAQTEISVWDNGKLTNRYHDILYKAGVDDDKPGFWYAGTAGLYYFHPGSGIASRYINTMQQGVQYPSSMLQDENFFWLATHDGLVKIKPAQFALYTIPESVNSSIDYYGILRTTDGRLLFGSNRGKNS